MACQVIGREFEPRMPHRQGHLEGLGLPYQKRTGLASECAQKLADVTPLTRLT